MPPSGRNPRTAERGQSIWRHLPEDVFRQNLVILEQRTNAVPVPSQVFLPPTRCTGQRRVLPLEIEQKLADDFAYIAAVGEGAQSVAAVCIEEKFAPPALCIRFAAVDAIDEKVQEALREVGAVLNHAANATSHEGSDGAENLLRTITRQHFQKLLGRLRSRKWQKPPYLTRTHKKSLWQDFENLIHRVQFVYPKKKDINRVSVEDELQNVVGELKRFENDVFDAEQDFQQMIIIVKRCYTLCNSSHVRDFALKLESQPNATPQIAAAIKTLHQVEKIGAYHRISMDSIRSAQKYSTLFREIEMHYLTPFRSVSTEIGFEKWARTLHVHAEVQLAVYYDLLSQNESPERKSRSCCYYPPRAIGTSKFLCYLCYLFIKHHRMFFPSNTHGRLYDQWTIPDLVEFSGETRQKYEGLIIKTNDEIIRLSEELGPKVGKRDAWRVEPMTSRQNLLLGPDKEHEKMS